MILPLILAALVCEMQNDNTWICRADDPYADFPTNAQGVAVCTNCVAMSPSDCQELKSRLSLEAGDALDMVNDAMAQVSNSAVSVASLISSYERFDSCPYQRVEDTDSVTGSMYTNCSTDWNNSFNRQFLSLPSFPTSDSTAASRIRTYNYIVGMWVASYEASQKSLTDLGDLQTAIDNSSRSLSMAKMYADTMRGSVSQISCAPCELSPGGSNTTSGVETGCAECYLKLLREIRDAVKDFRSDFALYANYMTNKVNRFFSDYDYATQMLDTDSIHIDLKYFDELVFGRVGEEATFNQDQFERLNYFSRIELLLGHLAGIQSNAVASVEGDRENYITNAVLNVTNDFMSAVNVVSNATSSFIGLTSNISALIDKLRDGFGSSSPNTDGIELLPANKWILDQPLSLRIPIEVQNFSHTLCTCIVYVSAIVGAWLLVSSIWSKVVSVLRWIFGLLSP